MKNKNKKKLKNNNNNSINKIIIPIILFIMYLVFGIAAFPNENNLDQFNLIYYVLCMLAMSFIVINIYKKEFIDEFKTFFKQPIKNILKCFCIFILLFLIITIGNFIVDRIFGWTNLNSNLLIFPSMKNLVVYSAMVLILYIPFIEGTMFTKVLSKIIDKKEIWIILSGVLYGFLQVGIDFDNKLKLLLAIPYIITGIIVAIIYEKKKNVFYPIFIWLFYYLLQFIIQSSLYWN